VVLITCTGPRPGVKACGLTGLLVIIEEREPWEQRL
jgi:hypothetical protein